MKILLTIVLAISFTSQSFAVEEIVNPQLHILVEAIVQNEDAAMKEELREWADP